MKSVTSALYSEYDVRDLLFTASKAITVICWFRIVYVVPALYRFMGEEALNVTLDWSVK